MAHMRRGNVDLRMGTVLVIGGLVAGILVAIMGVGGGFLLVPAMIYLISGHASCYRLGPPTLRDQGRLGAVGGVELSHNPTDMHLNGALLDVQRPGNDLVRLPCLEQLEDPQLAWRETLRLGRLDIRALPDVSMPANIAQDIEREECAALVNEAKCF